MDPVLVEPSTVTDSPLLIETLRVTDGLYVRVEHVGIMTDDVKLVKSWRDHPIMGVDGPRYGDLETARAVARVLLTAELDRWFVSK